MEPIKVVLIIVVLWTSPIGPYDLVNLSYIGRCLYPLNLHWMTLGMIAFAGGILLPYGYGCPWPSIGCRPRLFHLLKRPFDRFALHIRGSPTSRGLLATGLKQVGLSVSALLFDIAFLLATASPSYLIYLMQPSPLPCQSL